MSRSRTSGTPAVFMIVSDDPDRFHSGLKTAMLTASGGRPAVVFFTRSGVLPLVQGYETAEYTALEARLDAAGLAGMDSLLQAVTALPVTLYLCADSLREHAIDRLDILTGPHFQVVDQAQVMEETRGGHWLVF